LGLGGVAVRRFDFDCGTAGHVIGRGAGGEFRYGRRRWAPGSS
jgi:hypothetical protein